MYIYIYTRVCIYVRSQTSQVTSALRLRHSSISSGKQRRSHIGTQLLHQHWTQRPSLQNRRQEEALLFHLQFQPEHRHKFSASPRSGPPCPWRCRDSDTSDKNGPWISTRWRLSLSPWLFLQNLAFRGSMSRALLNALASAVRCHLVRSFLNHRLAIVCLSWACFNRSPIEAVRNVNISNVACLFVQRRHQADAAPTVHGYSAANLSSFGT